MPADNKPFVPLTRLMLAGMLMLLAVLVNVAWHHRKGLAKH
ncbi:MAG: hypothetical protein ABII64_06160 [Elusimicrobiota bacterium]